MEGIYWSASEKEALSILKTSRNGLSESEARFRLLKYGSNSLKTERKRSNLSIFLSNFNSPIAYILLAAALLSMTLGNIKEMVVILMVLFINATIGYFQEAKAEKTLEALKKITKLKVNVVREGQQKVIDSEDLVPGDIVLISEGTRVPADGRLVEAVEVLVNESVLTGESAFVDKKAAKEKVNTPQDAKNLLFMGTTVVKGKGLLLVTNTGLETEFGQIGKIASDEFHTKTPLQVRMEKLSKQIGIIVLLVCVFTYLVGTLGGLSPIMMFEVAISMAVSAIPSGLPVAISVVLVIGMRRMAQKKAIIRKLSAVETLGTTTVIASDKTGTLTHNKLSIIEVLAGEKYTVSGDGYGMKGNFLLDGIIVDKTAPIHPLLEAAVLVNDGEIRRRGEKFEVFGDPVDCAILVAAHKIGIDKSKTRRYFEILDEMPFNSDRKMASILVGQGRKRRLVTKGAFEEIIKRSSTYLGKKMDAKTKGDILLSAAEMAERGLRVIAVAEKNNFKSSKLTQKSIDSDLNILGLFGMKDTFRMGAKKAISICKEAGIKIIMLTGDHLETAKNIGHELGILTHEGEAINATELANKSDREIRKIVAQTTVFARMKPEIKYKIINAYQSMDAIIAMTGDGVNDVPALKTADIGVAMGAEGTDAAKEAADMVLTDDNFSTIVFAVEEGRTIFDNIRKTVYYLFSTSFGEVLAIIGSIVFKLPLILYPLQILWVNMVTDTAVTIPLGMEKTEVDQLKRPPRPKGESIISKTILRRSLLVGITIGTSALLIFMRFLPEGEDYARTLAFGVLVVTQWFNAFSARSSFRSVFRKNPFSNPYILGGILFGFLGLMLVIYVGPLNPIFGTIPLTLNDWGLVVLYASPSLFVAEIDKLVSNLKSKKF